MPSSNHLSDQLIKRYQFLVNQINNNKNTYHYSGHIKLIAVSKNTTIKNIIKLNTLGQQDFAENYLQDAINKINDYNQFLQDNSNINNKYPIIWHYIGRLQSNKLKTIARYFDWVHSVDNIKKAEKLNFYCGELNKKLNILIQVNIDQDDNKSGLPDHETLKTIQYIHQHCPCLNIYGLMCMLKQDNNNFITQSISFKKLNNLLIQINQELKLNLTFLSMGMSNDYPAAIYALGDNINNNFNTLMLRIGSSLFGEII